MMEKLPVIAVVGPAASGKTALAIELAEKFGGEVISADSMQIYKGLDIATAKPTNAEMKGIKHHLISVIEPGTAFSLANYLELARAAVNDVHGRGKMPIICGGTGLYVSSLLDNIKLDETENDGSVRRRLTEEKERFGNNEMLARLEKIDPETAKTLHPNNINRIIRALEVYEVTGKTFSQLKEESRREETPYNSVKIGLDFRDRQVLYDRINRRVDIMTENGMIEEARAVFEARERQNTSLFAIGYKELIPYFEGKADLVECTDKIKQESRRYAKRQLTWFRRDKEINWIYGDEEISFEKISQKAQKVIANGLEM